MHSNFGSILSPWLPLVLAGACLTPLGATESETRRVVRQDDAQGPPVGPVVGPVAGQAAPNQPPMEDYDFARPAATFELPARLTEISALTDIDEHTVACVQDELGSVFYVDLRDGQVLRELHFGAPGDYEGLTRVGDKLWVLQSSGGMVELSEHDGELEIGRKLQLDLDHEDIEGLGYDAGANALLVAPKDPQSGSKQAKARRRVFAVDPTSGQRREALALDTSLERIVADAERAGIELPGKQNKHGDFKLKLKVRFSAVAVHPLTDQVWVLSGVDGAVLVFDRAGTLVAAQFVDQDVLPQIEGLTFLANGDLVIASEGKQGPARIQRFAYRESERR